MRRLIIPKNTGLVPMNAHSKCMLSLIPAGVILVMVLLLTNVSVCRAQDAADNYTEQNPDTGYIVVIEDNADLLTKEQETDLADVMRDITAYGNVAFKTIDNNHTSAESYARSYYKDKFGTKSGTLFLIDMDNRILWIHSDGAIYRVVTKSYAETITDNVYRKASAKDYYGCAEEVYGQIFALLEGDRVAQPMKYISNLLLAMILALFVNFGIVCYFTKMKKPKEDVILRKLEKHFSCTTPEAVFTHETRIYDPQTSSDGGGGSSSSGGSSSGGGGGSSSGGGGGHSF